MFLILAKQILDTTKSFAPSTERLSNISLDTDCNMAIIRSVVMGTDNHIFTNREAMKAGIGCVEISTPVLKIIFSIEWLP
jgi:hypothetical protein